MTIKQLLEMPIGQRTGGFLLTVKTAKKHWEVPNKEGQTVGHKGQGRVLHQQAILTDETGEMIADIKILSPEHGNQCDAIKVGAIIRVIVCEIQTAYDKIGASPEPNKKLYIDQFVAYIKDVVVPESYSSSFNDEMQYGEPLHIVKSKVKMHVVCAILTAGNDPIESFVDEWVDKIVQKKMTGA